MLDARQEADSYRRIEGDHRGAPAPPMDCRGEGADCGGDPRGRRRRHGIARGLLRVWRHKVAAAARVKAPGFVPVRVDAEGRAGTSGECLPPAQTTLPAMAPPPAALRGMIEVEVSGARIRVELAVDRTTLSTVLSALRAAR